jgi:hypothetical protein
MVKFYDYTYVHTYVGSAIKSLGATNGLVLFLLRKTLGNKCTFINIGLPPSQSHMKQTL